MKYNSPEFEFKADIQYHQFGWVRLENRFFLINNNNDKKFKKNSIVNELDVYEHISQLKFSQ